MQHNYYDILKYYCDLNDLPYHSSRDQVVDYISKYPKHYIKYNTPYGRVFELIRSLMSDSIDLATLMSSWDVSNPLKADIFNIKADCLVVDTIYFFPNSLYDKTIIIK